MISSATTPAAETTTLGTRIAESIAALALGVAVGGVGTFAHQLVWSDLGFPVPVGLVGGLFAVLALLAGVRIVFESRLYSVVAAMGIVSAVALLALPGVNGSVLLPDNLSAVAWSVGPTLIAVVVLAWPRLPQRRTPRRAPGEESGSSHSG